MYNKLNMPSKKQRFIIIDGNALIHRAFHALPPLTTKNGQLVNAVYGFTTILLKVIREFKPTHLAVTYDVSKKTFRHQAYPDYKAKRKKQPDELYAQIPLSKKIVESLKIPIYEQPGYEADDVIGTLTANKNVDRPDIETIIVTGDLDALQLIDANTKVHTMRKGFADTVTYDGRMVEEKFGLKPKQIIDLKALAGDASDNIPGVSGIGQQTATKLLQKFGSVEKIYEKLENNEDCFKNFRSRAVDLLKKYKSNAFLSKKLATIVKTVPLDFSLKQTERQNYDRNAVIALFQEFEFKSLLNRLPDAGGQTNMLFSKPEQAADIKQTPGYQLIDTEKDFEKFILTASRQSELAVDTETTSLNTLSADLLGISISWRPGEAYYLNVSPGSRLRGSALKEIGRLLQNHKIKKYGHNIKFDLAVLSKIGLDISPISFDTMVASYLLNPSSRQHSLDTLVFTELGHEMIPIEKLIGKKGKSQLTLDRVPLDKVVEYACEDADYTYRLVGPLRKQLAEKSITGLFEKIELPLIPVLEKMERCGVLIDSGFLSKMSAETEKKINVLEKNIYKQAGEKFNINSPIQLKKILFDKLDIDTEGIGVTKTGYSTAASELEKMKDAHHIVPLISEYRELAKLKSTYLDALPELISPQTGRVHTSFNQTITATGRLSSSNPNLQNIPIRTSLGREIRKAFVAPPGFQILSADYSQIELRIVASLADDPSMIEAFKNNEDIHARTAAEINGCDIESVTKEMRRAAKTINFGILYGMGTYGLARSADMDVSEASEYIETYFEHHEAIRKYFELTKALARKKGFVETLFGRRRYLPEINSGIQQVRASAERMAINMPVQGTAADLMKLAMIEIDDNLPKISPQTKMILQVHDELVFEVPKRDISRVIKYIRETMENIYRLRVPIKADVETGSSWGLLKTVK